MTRKQALYNSKLAVLAYLNKDQINWDEYGLSLVKWIENKKSDTQGFVAIKGKTIYVVWRGSESKKDFQNDASIDKVPFIGGALATLYAHSIKKHYSNYNVSSTTIGSPRVGNKIFKENYDNSNINTLRIVHNNDLVTHTPYIRFYHVNYQLRLDNNGNVLKRDTSLKALWLYLKSLFSGKNIKDHMGDGYLKALENWAK